MKQQRYLIAFLVALSLHALLFWRSVPFFQPPENGLAAGNSSLEVGLVAMQDTAKLTEEPPQVTKKPSRIPSAFSQQKSSRDVLPPQKKSFQGTLGSSTTAPSYLHNPQPTYPEGERRSGHEGIVLLRVTVSGTGKVESILLEHSSGYPLLDQRASETVATQWQFQPARNNKETFASEVLIPIHFSLNGTWGSVP